MKIFSLPINPKLEEEFVYSNFIPFLQEHKHLISDLYFTCRMPPFLQDAMGDVFETDIRMTTMNALHISREVDIPLSATFNNIYVVPNQRNLDTWIENFRPLYNEGCRIVTLPHTSWVLTGQIQREFPDLYIKNTILREVTKANDIVQLAQAGFNYVNLDRDLMRDRDQLLRIKQAKEYCDNDLKISLLVNEGCWGGCPIMPEHYHYNNSRMPNDPQYFDDPISRVSCSLWDVKDPAASLKAANLPPWKKDWEEILDLGVDVFKLHGRENAMRLKESMDIIKRWNNDEELLFPEFEEYMEDTSIAERPIDVWREKIKTCKFDCWDCHYCDTVAKNYVDKKGLSLHPYVERVLRSIEDAAMFKSGFEHRYTIPGFTSNRVRHFLNNLCSESPTIYLELGCYTGSTFYAATHKNGIIAAYAVDNFESTEIEPFREEVLLPKSKDPKKEFLSNFYHPNWSLIHKNIPDLIGSDIPLKPNVIFYDADHDHVNQLANLNSILGFLPDEFILVLDDANFQGVVSSADEFVETNNLKPMFRRKILTSVVEDDKDWWNGLYILVLSKS